MRRSPTTAHAWGWPGLGLLTAATRLKEVRTRSCVELGSMFTSSAVMSQQRTAVRARVAAKTGPLLAPALSAEAAP